MKGVYDYLERLGLSEIEAKLYIGLLEKGSSTIMQLANHVGIKRITAHFNTESLILKGLVTETRKGARRQVVAEPPDRLTILIQKRETEIAQVKSGFPEVMQMMQRLLPKAVNTDPVEVRYYEGENGVNLVYEEALKGKMLRSYVNLDLINAFFPDNVELFISAMDRNQDLKITEIIDGSDTAMKLAAGFARNDRYRYKFASEQLKLSAADTLIFDGKVAVVNVRKKPSGIIFTSKDYYNTSKEIFDFIWKILPA